jgi:hypothetical protein
MLGPNRCNTSMLLRRIHPAARLLPGLLIVSAAAWLGLSFVGTGQPVHAQSPTNGRAAAGRVEGGSDVLSLGTAASESPICWCTLAPAFRQARIWSESSAGPSSARAKLANRIWRWPKRFMWGRWSGLREAISVGGQTSILPRQASEAYFRAPDRGRFLDLGVRRLGTVWGPSGRSTTFSASSPDIVRPLSCGGIKAIASPPSS